MTQPDNSLILKVLQAIKSDIADLKKYLHATKADLQEQILPTQADLHEQIVRTHEQFHEAFSGLKNQMHDVQGDFLWFDRRLGNIETRLERIERRTGLVGA
jgi:hypothetical protein